jgi:hypothetical protein
MIYSTMNEIVLCAAGTIEILVGHGDDENVLCDESTIRYGVSYASHPDLDYSERETEALSETPRHTHGIRPSYNVRICNYTRN